MKSKQWHKIKGQPPPVNLPVQRGTCSADPRIYLKHLLQNQLEFTLKLTQLILF